jgi:hypothetical protein
VGHCLAIRPSSSAGSFFKLCSLEWTMISLQECVYRSRIAFFQLFVFWTKRGLFPPSLKAITCTMNFDQKKFLIFDRGSILAPTWTLATNSFVCTLICRHFLARMNNYKSYYF